MSHGPLQSLYKVRNMGRSPFKPASMPKLFQFLGYIVWMFYSRCFVDGCWTVFSNKFLRQSNTATFIVLDVPSSFSRKIFDDSFLFSSVIFLFEPLPCFEAPVKQWHFFGHVSKKHHFHSIPKIQYHKQCMNINANIY